MFKSVAEVSAKLAPQDAAHAKFLLSANSAVAEHRDSVIKRIQNRDLHRGRWHPNGFVVFDLDDIRLPDGLGRLRVHIWPRGLRKGLKGHPPVHPHAWRLFSEVLAGEYRNTNVDVFPAFSSDGTRPRNAARVYRVEYGSSRHQGDTLRETDQWMFVVPKNEARSLAHLPGNWHHILPGDFHATPIPRYGFCATLLVKSPRDPSQEVVLLGNPAFETNEEFVRPELSDIELEFVCKQFAAELSKTPVLRLASAVNL